MTRWLPVVAVLGVALAGCTNDPSDHRAGATTSEAMPSLGGATASAPPWFAQRPELPSCGIDEPGEDGYPNQDARECFQGAYELDQPAELTYRSYGDEGESIRAHFRVLGGSRYEIVAEWFPGPLDGGPSGHGWVRYECERFVFDTRPDAVTFGWPAVNAEGECVLVEYVPA